MNKSKITRAVTRDGSARIVFADETQIVQTACAIHNTSKTMTAALGRTLIAASLMGSMLKNKGDCITVQFAGDGPAGKIVCTAEYTGDVRGYAENPRAELPLNKMGKLDVGGAIGKGSLYVIKDIGRKEPYIGSIPIKTGEVGDDISEYLARSEQTASVVALGVRAQTAANDRGERHVICPAAGGFIVQLLPNPDPEIIDILEENISKLEPVSQLIERRVPAEEIIGMVFRGIEFDLFDEIEVGYRCPCSRERYENGLMSLGTDELSELDDGNPVECVCCFCGQKYVFQPDEIRSLIGRLKKRRAEQDASSAPDGGKK